MAWPELGNNEFSSEEKKPVTSKTDCQVCNKTLEIPIHNCEQMTAISTSEIEDSYAQRISGLMEYNGVIWVCVECGYTSRIKGHVTEHVERHIDGYIFSCSICNNSFQAKSRLHRHYVRYHKLSKVISSKSI